MLLHFLIDWLAGDLPFKNMLLGLIFSLTALLMVFPIHECAHGLMALAFGDKTAKYQKRLSLNPLAHIDVRGFLFLLIFGFGWARPVQFNPINFKHRRFGTIMTAAAGPLANILFCFISLFLYCLLISVSVLYQLEWLYILSGLFEYMMMYNASFAIFNLIPFPPLDGSKIVAELLPLKHRIKYYRLEDYSFYFFLILIVVLNTTNILSILSYGLVNAFLPLVSSLLGGIF